MRARPDLYWDAPDSGLGITIANRYPLWLLLLAIQTNNEAVDGVGRLLLQVRFRIGSQHPGDDDQAQTCDRPRHQQQHRGSGHQRPPGDDPKPLRPATNRPDPDPGSGTGQRFAVTRNRFHVPLAENRRDRRLSFGEAEHGRVELGVGGIEFGSVAGVHCADYFLFGSDGGREGVAELTVGARQS
jgi:hypothetical protein